MPKFHHRTLEQSKLDKSSQRRAKFIKHCDHFGASLDCPVQILLRIGTFALMGVTIDFLHSPTDYTG